MPLRSGSHGYGSVAKVLHWLTVAAIAVQFPIGYVLHNRAAAPGDPAPAIGPLPLQGLHVAVGLTIFTLALIRTVWRVTTALPPWAEYLSTVERKIESINEKVMLTLLFAIPASGLLFLVADAPFALHVSAQLAFLAALAVHVALVLRHTVVHRDRYLSRML